MFEDISVFPSRYLGGNKQPKVLSQNSSHKELLNNQNYNESVTNNNSDNVSFEWSLVK